jgi:hypothetical protein
LFGSGRGAFSGGLAPGFLCAFSGLFQQSTDLCPCLPQRLQSFLNFFGKDFFGVVNNNTG